MGLSVLGAGHGGHAAGVLRLAQALVDHLTRH